MTEIKGASDSPPALRNRAEIHDALIQAQHLEHGLALLYMNAAFSLRRSESDFADWVIDEEKKNSIQLAQNYAHDWAKQLLLISRQEMEHLGIVLNLFNAIGEELYINRPNFPISADAHAIDIPFHLSRFKELSLLRFMEFEKPDSFDSLLPQPPVNCVAEVPPEEEKDICHSFQLGDGAPRKYSTVEQLYGALLTALTSPNLEENPDLAPENIFVGDPKYQVKTGKVGLWGKVYVEPIYNHATAKKAIHLILEQGEGRGVAPNTDKTSHYERYVQIYTEYKQFQTDFPGLDIALPVVCNPMVDYEQKKLNTKLVNVITAEPAKSLMILFNEAYFVMLVMLKSWFSTYQGYFGNYPTFPDVHKSEALYQAAFFPFMTMVIRPLGELIMRVPAGDGYDNKTAGPSFQIVQNGKEMPLGKIPYNQNLDWYLGQFDSLIKKTKKVAGQNPGSVFLKQEEYNAQLEYLQQNLHRMKVNFESVWKKANISQ